MLRTSTMIIVTCLLISACQKNDKRIEEQLEDYAQVEQIGIEGTDLPHVTNQGDTTFYFYEKNMVMTIPYADESGEEIRIYLRQPELKPELYPFKKDPLVILNQTAQWFFGLKGNLLFMDMGTGPDVRILNIYDLSAEKSVFSGPYTEPIVIQDHRLSFFQEMAGDVTPENCPDVAEWKRQGLGAVLEEMMLLDMQTFLCSKTGEVRCSPRQ